MLGLQALQKGQIEFFIGEFINFGNYWNFSLSAKEQGVLQQCS